MKIVNRQHKFLKDKQIQKIYSLLPKEYQPKRLIIVDTWFYMLKYLIPCILDIRYWESLLSKYEGIYFPQFDTIFVFVYAQNYKEYNKADKKLYSIHALLHESRHRWQYVNNFQGDKERDADQFATQFVNNNSFKIFEIMRFKNEWKVEEKEET